MGARADLDEFLTLFGIDRARARLWAPKPTKKPRAKPTDAQLSGAPPDEEARRQLFGVELEAAAPLLGRLVQEARELQTLLAARLPDEDDLQTYLARRMQLVNEWNRGIYDGHWVELPPLCDVCGLPVLGRGGQKLPSGDYELSTVCGDKCRATRRKKEERSRA